MKKAGILLLFLLTGFSCLCFAQAVLKSAPDSSKISPADTIPKKKIYLSVGFGANSYRGSLSEKYQQWLPSLQLSVKFKVKRKLTPAFHLSSGTVIAENLKYTLDRTKFPEAEPSNFVKTRFTSFHVDWSLSLFKNKHLDFFAAFGVGFCRYRVYDKDNTKLAEKSKSRARGETFSPTAFMIPVHFGVHYWFNPRIGFTFLAGWYNLQTRGFDNMDKLAGNSRKDNMANFNFQLTGKIGK